jgi:1-acyl-sn-glycerol-3-phosphate acyltransferase
MADALRAAPKKTRELRSAVQLDVPWARTWIAGLLRENFMRFILNPVMDYYARRRATGMDKLTEVDGPVILVANHASHMDTPVILSALPRQFRKRTVVVAAADYFYRNRAIAWIVSLIFNTTPIDRRGGAGGWTKNGDHLENLLEEGWNLLLYPEGTRSRSGVPGRVRRGAAVLAAQHHLSIVPIRVSGTAEAMPPGRMWPKRLVGKLTSKRHRITVAFGDPIAPNGDTTELIKSVQQFFEQSASSSSPYMSPYTRFSNRHKGSQP